jgi:hypothetical protein
MILPPIRLNSRHKYQSYHGSVADPESSDVGVKCIPNWAFSEGETGGSETHQEPALLAEQRPTPSQPWSHVMEIML